MIYYNCSLVRNERAISTYEVFNSLQIENFTKMYNFMSILISRSPNQNVLVLYLRFGKFYIDMSFSCLDFLRVYTLLLSKYILDQLRKSLRHKYTFFNTNYHDLRWSYYKVVLWRITTYIKKWEALYGQGGLFTWYQKTMNMNMVDLLCKPRPLKQRVPIYGIANKDKSVFSLNVVRDRERLPTQSRVSMIEKKL